MTAVRIHELLPRDILVTRDSARAIQLDLAQAVAEGKGEIVLDFSGVAGLTPSFFDELLGVIEECTEVAAQQRLRVTVEDPPTSLSSKFLAVGRGTDSR